MIQISPAPADHLINTVTGLGRASVSAPVCASLLVLNMSTELEETLKRIQSHKGVKGVLICNAEVGE